MFDFMIRILPNNRLLVRNNSDKTSEVLRPDQISAFFEDVLREQLKAQEEQDDKIAGIKSQVEE